MHVKHQLNWDNRFVKTVNKKKLKLHKFALVIRISKIRSFQTCIARPPIFRPNLFIYLFIKYHTQKNIEINRPVSYSATEHQSYFHDRQTDGRIDRRTDGRTDVADDNNR